MSEQTLRHNRFPIFCKFATKWCQTLCRINTFYIWEYVMYELNVRASIESCHKYRFNQWMLWWWVTGLVVDCGKTLQMSEGMLTTLLLYLTMQRYDICQTTSWYYTVIIARFSPGSGNTNDGNGQFNNRTSYTRTPPCRPDVHLKHLSIAFLQNLLGQLWTKSSVQSTACV